MKNIDVLHKFGSDFLSNRKAIGIKDPYLETEILLQKALNLDRTILLLKHDEEVSQEQATIFFSYLERRANGEPIAYITNKKEFWSLDFYVDSTVLIPRPETEDLIETILKYFPHRDVGYKILDLGCGSGAIGISLLKEYPGSQATLIDISEEALYVSAKNAQYHQVMDRTTLILSNWLENIKSQEFDIIVSNPPYIGFKEEVSPSIMHEPRLALFAAENGLSCYHLIAKSLKSFMHSDSRAFLEFGYKQAQEVFKIFTQAGYTDLMLHKDSSKIYRIICFKNYSNLG